MSAMALDHVGVVGSELTALAAAFDRIGFRLTPVARHAGGRTGNRCAMLRAGYLELISVMPGGSSATLDRFLARHAGAHIAALAIDDPEAEASRLARADVAGVTVTETERQVMPRDPKAPLARFTVVMPPDRTEGRVLLVRHHTADHVWNERALKHPNRAVGLAELLVASTEPAATAAWMSRVAGWPVLPDPQGGYRLDLPNGRVRMLTLEAAAALLPGIRLPVAPCMAGVTVVTDDGNTALLRLLGQERVAFRRDGSVVVVPAGGVGLRFVPRGLLE